MSRTNRAGCSPFGYRTCSTVPRAEWESWFNEHLRPRETYERYATFNWRDHPPGVRNPPAHFRRHLNRGYRAKCSAEMQKWHSDRLLWQCDRFFEEDEPSWYPSYRDIELPRHRRNARWLWW